MRNQGFMNRYTIVMVLSVFGISSCAGGTPSFNRVVSSQPAQVITSTTIQSEDACGLTNPKTISTQSTVQTSVQVTVGVSNEGGFSISPGDQASIEAQVETFIEGQRSQTTVITSGSEIEVPPGKVVWYIVQEIEEYDEGQIAVTLGQEIQLPYRALKQIRTTSSNHVEVDCSTNTGSPPVALQRLLQSIQASVAVPVQSGAVVTFEWDDHSLVIVPVENFPDLVLVTVDSTEYAINNDFNLVGSEARYVND